MSSDRTEIDEMVSQQVEATKTPSNLPMEGNKMPSKTIETYKAPEQMEPKNIASYLSTEVDKVASEITETDKSLEQMEPDKIPSYLTAEGDKTPSEIMETDITPDRTEKLTSELLEGGKTSSESIKVEEEEIDDFDDDYDDNMRDKDTKCIECEACKTDPHYQATQLTITVSKRCLECEQNLCDRCFRFHRVNKTLKNHLIVDIRCQIEKNAEEPSQSKVDNLVEQTICEGLDSAKLNVSSDCLSTTHAQHQNNEEDVMIKIRKERDRLKEYEAEMAKHWDLILKAQDDIKTKADDIMKIILNKYSECLTRLERDKECLLEQLNTQTNEYLSGNETKLKKAIRYLEKITDREKNLDEIINKGSVDSNDESTKSLLLHIHFQRPTQSLDNVSFNESSSWTGSKNILGKLEGLNNTTQTQTDPTLRRYRTLLKNAYSLAKDAKAIHWNLMIDNHEEVKNLIDLKNLQVVQNELKLKGNDRKLEKIQRKHVQILSSLYAATKQTSDWSSEDLESHLNELLRNIGRLWNIIEFQIHYRNSEKGLNPEGFRNYGNTCYFNAVLQCLLQTVLLPFELCVNLYDLENDLTEHKEIYCLSKAFMDLASRYNEPTQRQGSLGTLYSMFKSSTQRFNDQEQHDSHDLLIHFLDKLRVEERNAWKIPSTGPEIQKHPTTVDKIFGGQFVTVYTCHSCDEPYAIREPFLDISIPLCTLIADEQKPEENKSKPETATGYGSKTFEAPKTVVPTNDKNDEQMASRTPDIGSKQRQLVCAGNALKSTSRCETELSSSSTNDEARKHSFAREYIKRMLKPIGVETSPEPETKRFWSRFLTSNPTVSQCLTYFTRAEIIKDEYLCRNCQTSENADLTMTSATKRTLISSPPAVLVLYLKRFEQKSTGFVKRDEMIPYDELLDLGPFCSSSALRIDPKEENVWYSLYAVLIHRGFFLSQGHYVAYVKQRDSSAQLKDKLREKFLQKNFGDREKVPNNDDLAALEKREAIRGREKAKCPLPIPGHWFYISDETVHRCAAKEALNQKAFLLFYERIPGCYHKATGV